MCITIFIVIDVDVNRCKGTGEQSVTSGGGYNSRPPHVMKDERIEMVVD